jgi:hypothetical protein
VVSIGAKYSFHAPGGFGAGASVLSGQRQLHDYTTDTLTDTGNAEIAH